MSKRSKIRWQESDEQELKRKVKNFNAKIERLAKKNPKNKDALPEKVSAKQMKKIINTRQDLKRELNALSRFSRRGSEEIITYGDYNVKLTKWQKNEMNRRAAVINRKRAKRLKQIEKLELTQGGIGLGYTKGQLGMGRTERTELSPINPFTPGMSQVSLHKKFAVLRKESKTDIYTEHDYRCRDNYIKGLDENFHPEYVAKIRQKILSMDIQDFLKKFYSEADADFEGLYFPNKNDEISYVNKLESIWL